MTNGTLDVRYMGKNDISATNKYHINFMSHTDLQGGAQRHREFISQESVLKYLVTLQASTMEIERREQRADEWLREARNKGTLSLPNFQLSDQEAAYFQR